MCLGGGGSSSTKLKYVKPDFKLPPLTVNPVQRVDPQYKEVMTGGQVRSLLMPMGISDG